VDDKWACLLKESEGGHPSAGNRSVYQQQLINTFNYLHFQDQAVLINFRHREFNSVLSLQAAPLPCIDGTFACRWIDKQSANVDFNAYKFAELLLGDGMKLISVREEPKEVSAEGILFNLPEYGCDVSTRAMRRHPCVGIDIEVMQNSVSFKGSLSDFNSTSLRMDVRLESSQNFHWVNLSSKVFIVLRKESEIIYSGICTTIRHMENSRKGTGTVVVEPCQNHAPRFKSKNYRNPRYQLSPMPNVTFVHPLTDKIVNLECEEISGSGFSVLEYFDRAVLMPGLIIPEIELEIAHGFVIKCKAQVVYSHISSIEDERSTVKCGVAYLDMGIEDQVRLSTLLHQLENRNAQVCKKVDLDALWQFFFNVGFVNRTKYSDICKMKEAFKETYNKLYMKSPNIARHFIFQDKGEILGHISMIRAYDNTWLFQHHAADRVRNKKAGLAVLKQISHYVNNFYLFDSTHMKYVICYYRTQNRFPEKVFGGIQRSLNDRRICSVDPFAYFHLPNTDAFKESLNSMPAYEGTALVEALPGDLAEMESCYLHRNVDLMLTAMGLYAGAVEMDALNAEYTKAGFSRGRHLFSLKRNGILLAIIDVLINGVGLNLSNLLNCLRVFVLRPDQLKPELLYRSLLSLAHFHKEQNAPIVLFPSDYAQVNSIPIDKIYNMWTMNVPEGTDPFFQFMDNLTHRATDD